MNKRLSIITINYNNRSGLQKTIESVIQQSFKDYEWIVIDGASSDGSKELLEVYSSYFTYWISEPDNGIYHAMNKGISKASGEYILFLNSGDYLYCPDTLITVFLKQFDEDVVYGVIRVDHGDRITVERHPEEITLGSLIYGTIHHSGCSFIRKTLFDKYGKYDESLKIVSDWKFFLYTVGLNGATVKFIDVIISVFDAHGIGTLNKDLCDRERKMVLEEVVPHRILQDYHNMEAERIAFREETKRIRSTYSYRLGHFILKPFRVIGSSLKLMLSPKYHDN